MKDDFYSDFFLCVCDSQRKSCLKFFEVLLQLKGVETSKVHTFQDSVKI